jgi:hypothetical protein
MCARILTLALVISLIGIADRASAQAPAQPTNAGPVQPWGLPPLPPGVGPMKKFADIHDMPQGKPLEGGSFDTLLALSARLPPDLHHSQPDGARVPPRCSKHRGNG